MSLIEMLLRLGCALVAWMVVYTYCLWLAVLRVTGCGSDGDEFWRLLLGFAPFAAGFSLLLGASKRMPELHRILRWGWVPLVLLVPLALIPVWTTFAAVNLAGEGICSPSAGGLWQRLWAPLQVTTLTVVVVFTARAWRAPIAH
ncbi:MAG: hypothetical protein AB7I04_05495 [Pseudomonadales bacterium]